MKQQTKTKNRLQANDLPSLQVYLIRMAIHLNENNSKAWSQIHLAWYCNLQHAITWQSKPASRTNQRTNVRIVSDAPEVVAMGRGRFGTSLSAVVHVGRRPDGRRQTETIERVDWGSRARESFLNLWLSHYWIIDWLIWPNLTTESS